MKFVRVHDFSDGFAPLSERLVSHLESGRRVLWLVPGGSNIPLSVSVMSKIPKELTRRLAIVLTDERYGPFGHADSNAKQLIDAGFNVKLATFLPVIRTKHTSIEQTVTYYNDIIEDALKYHEIIIGQFGMGADGHIAGILPHSPPVTAVDLVLGYTTETFTRITLTPLALARIQLGYIFAFGEEKRAALENLRSSDLPIDEQPAQILKKFPEAYVYNDLIGDDL